MPAATGGCPAGRADVYGDAGENECALKAYDVEKRAEEVLVEGVPFKDVSYAWAPDESFLVATVTERFEEKGKEKDFKRFVNMADRDPKWRDRSFLYLVDRDSGRMRRLTAGVGNAELCDISPDGSKVLFAVSRVDYSKRRYAVHDLWVMNPRSMACEALLRMCLFRCRRHRGRRMAGSC